VHAGGLKSDWYKIGKSRIHILFPRDMVGCYMRSDCSSADSMRSGVVGLYISAQAS
jgi:hypothetical protein